MISNVRREPCRGGIMKGTMLITAMLAGLLGSGMASAGARSRSSVKRMIRNRIAAGWSRAYARGDSPGNLKNSGSGEPAAQLLSRAKMVIKDNKPVGASNNNRTYFVYKDHALVAERIGNAAPQWS